MREKLLGFARLARPANLPTAAADIIAGIAICLSHEGISSIDFFQENMTLLVALVFSSVFLYAGGVVFNDVFDAKLDAVERQERAIPSGLVSLKEAVVWGIILLALGVTLAFVVNQLSGLLAVVLVATILLYDAIAKKYSFFGPLVMGLCRGLNLLLGMSFLGNLNLWWIAIVPVAYIFAITLISRGEVHGENKRHIVMAGILYLMVGFSMAYVVIVKTGEIVLILPFLLLFSYQIFRPLIKAYHENSPSNIKKAVMAGVLSLVIMDACWAVGFSNWYVGLGVLLLLPLSLLLSKLFAVT
ncbi:UbiA-like protein EboC [Maribacter sp. CXY002]|uniref:UbiA-like protein EboC n=1 Tax=Maribacter luteocoastalis TaxID=3407671 RepID=UPI003B66FE45